MSVGDQAHVTANPLCDSCQKKTVYGILVASFTSRFLCCVAGGIR